MRYAAAVLSFMIVSTVSVLLLSGCPPAKGSAVDNAMKKRARVGELRREVEALELEQRKAELTGETKPERNATCKWCGRKK